MEISNYLVENWPTLAAIGCEMLLVIIFAILKKKPVVRSLEEWCLHIFEYYGPGFINAAENEFLHDGEKKKAEVIKLLMIKLNDLLDIDGHADKDCRSIFGRLIEEALSCPQKK